jgi:hypothetical protein
VLSELGLPRQEPGKSGEVVHGPRARFLGDGASEALAWDFDARDFEAPAPSSPRGFDGHILDDAAETARAIEGTLRSFEYLDASEVARIEVGRASLR